MTNYSIKISKDSGGKFRWRRVSANGRVLAASSKGFQNRENCILDEKSALVIGWQASEHISRVEGLSLSSEMSATFGKFTSNGDEPAVRRAALLRDYGGKVTR